MARIELYQSLISFFSVLFPFEVWEEENSFSFSDRSSPQYAHSVILSIVAGFLPHLRLSGGFPNLSVYHYICSGYVYLIKEG